MNFKRFFLFIGFFLSILFIFSVVIPINRTQFIKKINHTSTSMFDCLLKDPNSFILKYVQVPFDLSYGSNSIPLTVSCLIAEGNYLELGMGSFSTPLLHKIAADYNRVTFSVDTDQEWVKKFISYNTSRNHRLFYVNNYENLEQKLGFNLTQLGVVLVDHIDAGRRAEHAKQFCNRSKIVIVHDAEKRNDGFYRYEKIFLRSYFKHACKFSLFQNEQKTFYISTLILSNYVDLNQFESIFNKIKSDYGHVACNLNL